MNNRGYTMIELVLVILIIGIIASVAVQSLISSTEGDRFDQTTDEMNMLARAIVGDERLISGGIRTDFGYVGDIGALPPSLDALVTNPGGYSTWKGPYFSGDFDEDVNGYRNDAWNNPYIYSGDVIIQSTAGGDPVSRRLANGTSDLISNTVTGFVRDVTGAPPGDSAANVTVSLYYPDGAGSVTSRSTAPSRSGEYSFSSTVPIGVHRLRAVISGVNDTTSRYVVVYPASTAYADLRFTQALWGGGTPGGSGSGNIVLVDGTQQFVGGNCNSIEFNITNVGVQPVNIISMTLTWPSPEAYYRRIRYDNVNVFSSSNPRQGSGQVSPFIPSQIIQPGAAATIRVEGFEDSPFHGNEINMRNTSFTVAFSDGSSFVVNMGDCSN